MPGAGNWQYRVDGGAWRNMAQPLGTADNKLHKFYVPSPVATSVQIRAHNGTTNCLTPIAGIGVYASDARSTSGMVVQNLGRDENFLATFARTSAGDPLAFFDRVVSNPIGLGMRPDLVIAMFSNDVILTSVAAWTMEMTQLLARIRPYADVLLLSPYEQSGRSTSTQASFRAATKSVAAAHDCAVLDLFDAWAAAGSSGFAAANAAGLMHDGLHPSQLGHNDIAARIWRVLRTFS